MRNDAVFRLVAKQVARQGGTNKQKSKYGVKGISILSQLTSIDFSRSFPPDSMPLWFENVIPDSVRHCRGKYRLDQGYEGSEVDDEASSTDSE